jgi:hypothetical protein
MHIIKNLALSGALLIGAAACGTDRLTIPNYNSPTVAGLASDPAGVQLLVTGIIVGHRNNIAQPAQDFGQFGREYYDYFPTDGRTQSSYLTGILNPQRLERAGFASGGWNGRYQNMKNAVGLINTASASGLLKPEEKKGVSGFAKTMRALDLLYIIAGRDSLGAPTEIPDDFSKPAPFATRDAVYTFIAATLDDAKADLGAAGSAFPFTLTAGFAGFNTPAGFLKFNRAIKARVDIYRATLGCGATCYTSALAAVGESFATPVGGSGSLNSLNTGVYLDFSAAPGDVQNGMSFAVTNSKFAHASAVTDAQKKTDGSPDNRLTRKITQNSAVINAPGGINIPATHHFIMYPTNASPVPIIRNEELILIRAEANIGLNNLSAALSDINDIRAVSGGLASLASLGATPLNALIYEKRFSTLFEGLRWVDMRRWGRLGDLPLDKAGQFVAKVMPIPQAECDARASALPNGCGPNQ